MLTPSIYLEIFLKLLPHGPGRTRYLYSKFPQTSPSADDDCTKREAATTIDNTVLSLNVLKNFIYFSSIPGQKIYCDDSDSGRCREFYICEMHAVVVKTFL